MSNARSKANEGSRRTAAPARTERPAGSDGGVPFIAYTTGNASRVLKSARNAVDSPQPVTAATAPTATSSAESLACMRGKGSIERGRERRISERENRFKRLSSLDFANR